MADTFFIPSLSSQSNVDSVSQIQRIMEAERVPLKRMESEQQTFRTEKAHWALVRQGINNLSEASRLLFQFDNAFSFRRAQSSNAAIITARADNNAEITSYEISVQQLAKAERRASVALALDESVGAGEYGIAVGPHTYSFSFGGGSVREFSRVINDELSEYALSRVLQINENEQIFILTSSLPGKENTLSFSQSFSDLAKQWSLEPRYELQQKNLTQQWPLMAQTLKAGEQRTLSFPDDLHSVDISAPTPISVHLNLSDGSQQNLVPSTQINIDPRNYGAKLQEMTITASEDTLITGSLEQQVMQSTPNILSTAQDTLFHIEGIPITRSSNTITDLIPGLNFTLHSTTNTPLSISVEPNIPTTKAEIINFVGSYNKLMQDINVLSRSDETLLEDIRFTSIEERTAAEERLGSLQGHSELNRIRFQLVSIMSDFVSIEENSYQLNDIGISTNQQNQGNLSSSTLLAYLEINETNLDQALTEDYTRVQEIFGFDSNEDLLIDNGFAYKLSEFLRPYIQNGGVLDVKEGTLDNQIRDKSESITQYTERLENYEAELRRDFAFIEQQMKLLEDNSTALDNFLGSQR